MKKRIAMVLMALMLVTAAAGAEEFAVEKENALAAVKVSLPEAVVDYAVRDYDDGGYEWILFFTQGSQIGEAKVLERTNEIRKVTLYEKKEGMLTASEAMALLAEKKGALVVKDLDLDRDDGVMCYEGEAELDGKRYEFEMSATGQIIEWERD